MNTHAPLNQKAVTKIVRQAHQSIAIILFVPASVCLYFIMKGFLQMGHLPHAGDPALISLDGPDRTMVMWSMGLMFYGIISWTAIVLLRRIFSVNITSRFSMIVGLIGVCLNVVLLVFNDQITWLLD